MLKVVIGFGFFLTATLVAADNYKTNSTSEKVSQMKTEAINLMTGSAFLKHIKQPSENKPLQDYAKGMQISQQISFIEGFPLYNWSGNWLNIPIEFRKWAAEYNGDFNNQVFKQETSIINEIQKYNEWVGDNLFSNFFNKDDFAFMNNDYGSASKENCYLNKFNHILYLINYYKPTAATKIIDIGSGWGVCSRELALLGYQVYSIDLDERHINYQKEHFCDKLKKDSFEYAYFEKNAPHLLDEKTFDDYCQVIQNKNIKYVVGSFNNKETLKQISEGDWNVVLALDTIQFMSPSELDNTLNTVSSNLTQSGAFIILTRYDYNVY